MQKLFKHFSALVLLGTGSLFANIAPGGFGVEVEYLYFRPSVDDTYFVLQSPVTTAFPNGTRENNDPGFHSGFRIGGTYAFCDCNQQFELSYARLSTRDTTTVSGGFLWATVGRPDLTSALENYVGSASSQIDTLYQRVDGLVSTQALCQCGMDLSLKAGFEYAYFRVNEDYTYLTVATSGLVSQRSRNWGIGPQFGMDFNYALFDSSCFCPGTLSLAAHSTGSILVSRTEAQSTQTLTGVAIADVQDGETWRIIPAFHARVGLNYETCFSCFGASLEIGYEFTTYLRGLSRLGFPDDVGDGLVFTNYYNFDVQGLYVAADLSF